MPTKTRLYLLRFEAGPLDGLELTRTRRPRGTFVYADAAGKLWAQNKPGHELYRCSAYLDGLPSVIVLTHATNTHVECPGCHVFHERPERRYGPEAILHAQGRKCSLCGARLN